MTRPTTLPTVALIGPDGAGKTTISTQLCERLPYRVARIYMGVNLDEATHMLPATRLLRSIRRGQGDTDGSPPAPRPVAVGGVAATRPTRLGRTLVATRAAARLLFWWGEEWYRLAWATAYRRRGHLVLFDRHFLSDFHATDVVARGHGRLSRRLHGHALLHWYPRPDVIIVLDAPAEVLFARKGEGTLASLEQRRRDYRALEGLVRRFEVIDTTQPVDVVVAHIGCIIEEEAAPRAGRSAPVPGDGGATAGRLAS